MQCIILEAKEVEGIAFNLADLAEKLNQLSDSRDNRGKVYELGTVLTMIIMARLSGEDKPSAIFEWIRARKMSFVSLLRVLPLKTRGNSGHVLHNLSGKWLPPIETRAYQD